MTAVRQLDLVVLALALAVFLAAGLPILGWAAVTVVWLVQRSIQVVVRRKLERSRDPRTLAGLMVGSMLGRTWLMVLVILIVGLNDRRAGLTAAVTAVVLFTVYFLVGMVTRTAPASDTGPATRSQRPAADEVLARQTGQTGGRTPRTGGPTPRTGGPPA